MDGITIAFFAFLWFDLTLVSGDGKISVKFVRYTNPGGKGENGHCCDGRSIFCEVRGCDHYFELCVDQFYGSNDLSQCGYGQVTTGVTKDKDSIMFDSSIGGTPNPFVLAVTKFQEPGMRFKVLVSDDDKGVNSDDRIETLYKRFTVTPARSKDDAVHETLVISGRTTLTLEVAAYCNDDWYGDDCATFCQQRNDAQGHYSCNRNSGRKQCHPGWKGESCNEQVNECESSPCLNGATCIDQHRSFLCRCMAGFTGSRCELDIDECSEGQRCHNGTCVNTAGSFHCSCFLGYTGDRCEAEIDYCLENPCENNGTCENFPGSFLCNCIQGYHGTRCAKRKDENACFPGACGNESVCVNLPSFGFECRDISEMTDNETTLERFCFNLTNSYTDDKLEKDTQSVFLREYLSQILPDLSRSFTNNNTESYDVIHTNNFTSEFHITGFECDCLRCSDGAEFPISNLLSNSNMSENANLPGTVVTVQNHSYVCDCKLYMMENVSDNKTTCEILNSQITCKCPGSNTSLCEPYSNRCPTTACSLYDLCFPVYVHKLDEISVAGIQTISTENSENQAENSDNISNTFEECVCMELDIHQRLQFCTSDSLLPDICSPEHCLNGGTCIANEDHDSSTQGLPTAMHNTYSGTDDVTYQAIIPQTSDVHSGIGFESETSETHTPSLFTDRNEEAFYCLCRPEYTGKMCENIIENDVCSTVVCQNNGTCISRHKHNMSSSSGNSSDELPYLCACPDHVTGAHCEHDDTNDKQQDDSENTEMEKTDASSAFMFEGKLSEKEAEEIQDTIVVILVTSNYDREDIEITYNIGDCVTPEKEQVSVFVFDVTVKGSPLGYDVIDDIFGDVEEANFQHLFPVPFYTGNKCGDVKFAYMTQQNENWFAINWYILVFPSLVFIVGAVTITFLYRRRRKHGMVSLLDNSVTNPDTTSSTDVAGSHDVISALSMLELQQPNDVNYGTTDTVYPMCFHNELYAQTHADNEYDYLHFPPREVKD